MIVNLVELENAQEKVKQFLAGLPEAMLRQRFIARFDPAEGAKTIMSSRQSLAYIEDGNIVGVLEMFAMGMHKRLGTQLNDCSPLSNRPGVCAKLFARARELHPEAIFACHVRDYASVPLFRYLRKYVDVLLHPLLHGLNVGGNGLGTLVIPYWVSDESKEHFLNIMHGMGIDNHQSFYHFFESEAPNTREALLGAATMSVVVGLDKNALIHGTISYLSVEGRPSPIDDVNSLRDAIRLDAVAVGYGGPDLEVIDVTLTAAGQVKIRSEFIKKYEMAIAACGLTGVVSDLYKYVRLNLAAFSLTRAGMFYVAEHGKDAFVIKNVKRAIHTEALENHLQLVDMPYSLYGDLNETFRGRRIA